MPYHELQAAKRTDPQADSKYWTLTIDDIEGLIVDFHASRARHEIKTADDLAKKKYGGSGGSLPSAAPSAATPTPAPANPEGGKPRPPTFTGQPDLTTTGKPGGGDQKSFGQQAASVLFG
jgi:hypothetical protein